MRKDFKFLSKNLLRTLTIANVADEVQHHRFSSTNGGNINYQNHFENYLTLSTQTEHTHTL